MVTLRIKNIVCDRCVKVIRDELTAGGLPPEQVSMGTVTYPSFPGERELERITKILADNGFELLLDADEQMVEQMKTLVLDHIYERKRKPASENFSDYLARELRQHYTGLSKLFSRIEGQTLEKFIIRQKIERAKELISYGEKSLGEIAFELDYSSTAHLSGQFKRETGLTPTQFRDASGAGRRSIDKL